MKKLVLSEKAYDDLLGILDILRGTSRTSRSRSLISFKRNANSWVDILNPDRSETI